MLKFVVFERIFQFIKKLSYKFTSVLLQSYINWLIIIIFKRKTKSSNIKILTLRIFQISKHKL